MSPMPVPYRWLAAILGVAFTVELLGVLDAIGSARQLLVLPGAALIALCVYVALARPVLGALLGAATLILSTGVIVLGVVSVSSVGLENITLTELVAGTALTVLVVWRATPGAAVVCTTALVSATVFASVVRGLADCAYFCFPGRRDLFTIDGSDLIRTAVLGFFLLCASVAVGLYLRHTDGRRPETELGSLVRRQWPLAAALTVLGLIELTTLWPYAIVGLFTGALVGACAFFAPKYPLRNALLAAVLISVLVLPDWLADTQWQSISFTTIAGSMALVAYLVRLQPVREAIVGTTALVVANLIAIAARAQRMLTDPTTVLILLFLLGVAVTTGWYFRSRDRERHQTVTAAITSAQQSERMALARELHDVVAHHVTGIVVQAQAAQLVAAKNPEVAVTALAKIERSGTEALTAMRVLVGSLRDGTPGGAAAGAATTDLRADLVALTDNVVGPPVDLDLDVPAQLPHEVGRSVLRLVQESLTNVGKHAPDASTVRVRVAVAGDELHIRVVDDGTTRPVNPVGGSGGYGLVGMRERVELLGGRFHAGPNDAVGWTVEAWLPLTKY